MTHESLLNALKEEGVVEVATDGEFDLTSICQFKLHQQTMSIQLILLHKFYKKAISSMSATCVQLWLWFINKLFD
jgi:hypothetical protein